jgi:type IV pili sensor histidine kinase/response regulator
MRMSFGRSVALSDALKQIAPDGWHCQLKPSMSGRFDRTTKVSWQGGHPWTQVLDTVVAEQDMSVDVDWDQKMLFIGDRSERPLVGTPINGLITTVSSVASSSPSMTSTRPAIPVWTLRQGYPIGKELASWAKQAGWHVLWQLPNDIVAPSNTPFSGDFPTAAAQVINDLAANGALIHYKAYDGNNVFRVWGPGQPTP